MQSRKVWAREWKCVSKHAGRMVIYNQLLLVENGDNEQIFIMPLSSLHMSCRTFILIIREHWLDDYQMCKLLAGSLWSGVRDLHDAAWVKPLPKHAENWKQRRI